MTRRPCLECGAITDIGARCPTCQHALDQRRNARRVWYSGSWSRTSKYLRTMFPCAVCGSWDRREVDHVTPRSLTAGTQVLCVKCHAAKTAEERRAHK